MKDFTKPNLRVEKKIVLNFQEGDRQDRQYWPQVAIFYGLYAGLMGPAEQGFGFFLVGLSVETQDAESAGSATGGMLLPRACGFS